MGNAQGSTLTVLSNEAHVDFPESVTFRLELEADQLPYGCYTHLSTGPE